MKKSYYIVAAILLLCLVAGCRKKANELVNPNNAYSIVKSPLQQFELIWNGVNNSYAFWDLETFDWDETYRKYRPLFEKLDEQVQAGQKISTHTLKTYYTDMFKDFHDHHMFISVRNFHPKDDDTITSFNSNGKEPVYSLSVNPGWLEIAKRKYSHYKNITLETILNCFEQMRENGHSVTELHYQTDNLIEFGEGYIIAAKINDVAYLHLSGYFLSKNYSGKAKEIFDQFLTWALDPNIKGVILDNRCNGGGDLDDLNFVIRPFITETMVLGDVRQKEGLGRYDYSPWIPFSTDPAPEHRKDDVKYVVLGDIHSVSMAEMTTYCIKEMPNGYFIGERTWGGHGPLADFNWNYAGTFGAENLTNAPGYFVYTSNYILRYKNGGILEGYGITPDFTLYQKPEELQQGIDRQLDAALEYIRDGKITSYPEEERL